LVYDWREVESLDAGNRYSLRPGKVEARAL